MDLTRKAGLGLALLTVAGFATTAPAQASVPYGLYNTGVDGNGMVLPDGATGLTGDQNYKLTYLGLNGQGNPSSDDILVRSADGYPIPPYVGSFASSAWIGPNVVSTSAQPNDLNGPDGYYDYRTTFTLPSSNYVVSGQWATDNTGVDIKINGQSTGNHIGSVSDNPATNGFQGYTLFTVSSGFQTGQNTLDFIVYNAHYDAFPNDNPTALRVDGITATVAPEPSSFAVFGFLGLGMAGLMLQARKRSASAA